MTRFTIAVVLAGCWMLAAGLWAEAQEKAPEKTVRRPLALVESEVITASDVEARVALELEEAERSFTGEALAAARKRIRSDALNRLIEEKLFTLEGRRLENENKPLKEWADRQVEDLQKEEAQKHGGQVAYQDGLSRRGQTLKQEKENLRNLVLRSFVLEKFVNKEAYASPAEISEYYRAHVQEFSVARQAAYRQVFLPTADFETPEKARERAEWICRSMAPDGHDFEEWVKKYSKGPRADRGGFWDLGEWSTNDEKLQQAILSLNENQVSEPLAGPGGFYLLKVERVVPAHTRTLREVQDDIRERILDEKQQERRKKLLDQLRGRFTVQVLEPD